MAGSLTIPTASETAARLAGDAALDGRLSTVESSSDLAGNLGPTHTLTMTSKRAFLRGTLTAPLVLTIAGHSARSEVFFHGIQDVVGSHTLTVTDGTTSYVAPIPTDAGSEFLARIYSFDGTDLKVEVAGGPVGPPGTNHRGAWVSGTSYLVRDAVIDGGSYWYCKLAVAGATAPGADPTHWDPLALKGDQGIPGIQGPSSPDAAVGTKGIVLMSAAPASAASPIAVSATDRLLTLISRSGRLTVPTKATHNGDNLSPSTRVNGSTIGRLVLTPWYAHADITLTDWQIQCLTALASAAYRVGIYTITDQAAPLAVTIGTKWADLTREVSSVMDLTTTGTKTVADPVAVLAGTWFAVGGVLQGALATLQIGASISGVNSVFGVESSGAVAASLAGTRCGVYMGDTVTGALPSGFTPTAFSTVGHGVGFRRSV